MPKNNKVLTKSQESAATEYKKKFLTERPSKRKVAVYIDKDLFDKMKAFVGMADEANLTKGSFMSAVLEDHMTEYGEIITSICMERQEQILSQFDA